MDPRVESCDPRRLSELLDTRTVSPAVPLSEGPGSRIGRYKLLQLIGEGGFGSVFMAEQETPVVRKVALKIIKLGMDTKQVIARFEAERQALAMMDHPNIAKVLDGGATETGRPYFVMELVRGVPITDFCDENKLTTPERLELFIPVCFALQHAHQKGIIHRDLKPGNVLVTIRDEKPVPMVIDFGIAKAVNQRLTEHTLFTEFRQLIGTPAYMSPEQARTNAMDVDTRSDIYSLGVLLYELLTGTTPFDARQLRGSAYAEVQRILREVEPPKPSTRLSTLAAGTQSALADLRKCDVNSLSRVLRGELDWIVMRALEKDRSRRYETASGLARDIRHYLSDEPVEACPPSAGYRLHKFIRKHRLPMGIAAAFLLVLIVATVVSSWQAIRATRANAREVAQRKQAEAVAQLLESVFDRLDPAAGQNSGEGLRRRLVAQLDRAAAKLNPPDYSGDPLVRSRLLTALGETELRLGETDKAEVLLRRALEERSFHGIPEDENALSTMNYLALTWDVEGRFVEAIPLLEYVRDREMKTLGPDDRSTLGTMDSLATAYNHAGRYPEAIAMLERVSSEQITTLGPDHHETLIALNNLGAAFLYGGHSQDAIKAFERAQDGEMRTLGPDNPDTLGTLNNLALAYDSAGRVAEAVAIYERIREPWSRIEGPDNPHVLNMLGNLATAWQHAGRLHEAITLLDQVRSQYAKRFGPEYPDTLLVVVKLANAYQGDGRTADAISLYEQVRRKFAGSFGPEHPYTLAMLNGLADSYAQSGLLPEAIELLERVRDCDLRTIGAEHPNTLRALHDLAGAYARAGRVAEAIKLYEQVHEGRIRTLGPDHPDTLKTVKNLDGLRQRQGLTPQMIADERRVAASSSRKEGREAP